jgi:hypothetical protein
MKNGIALILLASLVVVGVLVVYQDGWARPVSCDYVEIYCHSNCQGTFTLGTCWTYAGGMYCFFTCKEYPFPSYTWPCEWPDPYEGDCKLY